MLAGLADNERFCYFLITFVTQNSSEPHMTKVMCLHRIFLYFIHFLSAPSYFHNDRQDHRASLCLFQRNSLKLSRIAVFKTSPVGHSSIHAVLNSCRHYIFASSISPSDSLTYTNPLDTIFRTCKNLIAVFFKRQYHDQKYPLLRQMLSVAKNDISDITNTQSNLYRIAPVCT